MPINSFKVWLMAFRPKTLTASIAPVLIGTSMAFGDGVVHFPSVFVCFMLALSLQIGTNLANDYFDFKKGSDTEERIGPKRVTQAGLIKPEVVYRGFIIAFCISSLCALWIVLRTGCWPLAFVAVLCIVSGICYTGGPKPLAYIGLGDVFVLIFFGPVAVAGTYYSQSLEMNTAVVLSGFGPGFISCAILAVNNIRDIKSDKKSGKNTLAVRFGRKFVCYEYYMCIICAALLPVLIYVVIDDHWPIVMASIIAIFALPIMYDVFTKEDGPVLNQSLAKTGQLLILYSIIFSIGWIIR